MFYLIGREADLDTASQRLATVYKDAFLVLGPSVTSQFVANKLLDLNLDVLIDLSGYTYGNYPDLWYMRLATCQAQFLGFASTMQSPQAHDFVMFGPHAQFLL